MQGYRNTKFLQLIFLLLFASCGQTNNLPNKLKIGLLDFEVKKSKVTEQLENDKGVEFGALWTGFNKINVMTNLDTLFVEVNIELSTPLNYDGGFEVARDTLFLYAKQLAKSESKEMVHSTITYKILLKGLTYKEIEFKEIN